MKIIVFLFLFISDLSSYTIKEIPFKKGEYFEYEISTLGIKVALQKTKILNITNIDSNEVYYIFTEIETIPVISKIYHLHDTIDTYIEKNTFLPVKIFTTIREGKWRNEVYIKIDQKNGNLYYKDKKIEKNMKFEGNLVGLDSAMFFLRNLEVYQNEKIKLAVSKKREIVYIEAKVVSLNEKIYVPAFKKYVKTIHFSDTQTEKAGIWITNDEKRIPVKIVSIVIPIGDYGVITCINELINYSSGE